MAPNSLNPLGSRARYENQPLLPVGVPPAPIEWLGTENTMVMQLQPDRWVCSASYRYLRVAVEDLRSRGKVHRMAVQTLPASGPGIQPWVRSGCLGPL